MDIRMRNKSTIVRRRWVQMGDIQIEVDDIIDTTEHDRELLKRFCDWMPIPTNTPLYILVDNFLTQCDK